MAMPRRGPRPIAERFWEKVALGDGCWEWLGAKLDTGYGRFPTHDSFVALAHRMAWTLLEGPIPPGVYVCHHCDNPRCVRPKHLFLGTQQDNVRDMVAKGRNAKGQFNGMARLTSEQVTEIRRRYADGDVTQRQLAAEFGVKDGAVSKIVLRLAWKEVA